MNSQVVKELLLEENSESQKMTHVKHWHLGREALDKCRAAVQVVVIIRGDTCGA